MPICIYTRVYMYIYINFVPVKNKILKPDINDGKLLKICLITDIILEYWSMEMGIKTEPAFIWFYSCNKCLHGQCPQY